MAIGTISYPATVAQATAWAASSSRVVGIGPQIGYVIPLSKEWQGYINIKGYKEFAAENRPEGWNAWLTFVISPAAPGEAPPSATRMITK